ncbi:plexin domain-containing protein 2-like isoform X2 [Condylostylus longicornis]|uniref:plexin domain-containing protein 2-like isoform X2 n=1 Tax=Condylostylus longicornis TaxID=2530218 RepID=UPI00244E3AA8|nr:plexin domain-containing protein 2-like isoform X2 [Condylostylus longicornis]
MIKDENSCSIETKLKNSTLPETLQSNSMDTAGTSSSISDEKQTTTKNFTYYNSIHVTNEKSAKEFYDSLKVINPNQILSNSYRKAIVVELSFVFPFYGNKVKNITIVTDGFIYTGDYIHSWLAATQYIAPLLANFGTNLSESSFVKYFDNGTSISVLWENVILKNEFEVGPFTFGATLHDNGDIIFTYYKIPIKIEDIQSDEHNVKVGLSDAYIYDSNILGTFKRKTIYEYHKVKLDINEIQNNSIIYLEALPTCLQYFDCESCTNHRTSFDCRWCPTLNRCSSGTDRKRQEWMNNGCHEAAIKDENLCAVKNTQNSEDPLAEIDVIVLNILSQTVELIF